MSASALEVDFSQIDEVASAISRFGDGAEGVINGVLHGEGAKLIGESIDKLVPTSGRRFKGHSGGAKGSAWQRYETGENLAVTVAAAPKRAYLYFPDDGSTTRRHAGNRQFFRRGGEAASPKVVDLCIRKLTEGMEL